MSKRALLAALLGAVLLVAAAALYINRTSAAPQAAEDCAEKPKPKNEFAMAAECDEGAAAPSPATGP